MDPTTDLSPDDVALKILHTADWHLGRRFPSFEEEDAKKLARARFEVVERIFGVAARDGVDAVLCAGDLFDEPEPRPEHYRRLAEILTRTERPGRPVILLPGNHDPVRPGSVWHRDHELRRLLPPSCHVVDRDDFELALGEDAVVLARPCTSTAGQNDNALALPGRAPGDARIRIGMVHGSSFEDPNWQQNFPIDRDAAVTRDLDYLAVGDTHAFRFVPADRKDRPTVYPSAPEATSFGEEDTGFCALVFFRRNRRAQVVRERVGRWAWRVAEIHTLEALRELCREDLRQTVLRVKLELSVGPDGLEEVERLLEQLRGNDAMHGLAGALQVERDGLRLDTTDLARHFEGLPSVLRAAAERLRAQEAEAPDASRRALYHLYRLSQELAPGAPSAPSRDSAEGEATGRSGGEA